VEASWQQGDTEAGRELAHAEGVFVGPVYTGKGLAGMLEQARTGRLPAGSNVAFVHTGDTGNLFEIPAVACGAPTASAEAPSPARPAAAPIPGYLVGQNGGGPEAVTNRLVSVESGRWGLRRR
jgi:hypothetical protein